MAELPMDIEKVVYEVLAEMGLAGKGDSSPRGTPSLSASPLAREGPGVRAAQDTPRSPQPSPGVRERDGELLLTGRVVTLADVADRLAGVRRVVVEPRAVVTPAVRDELLRNSIELICGEPGQAAPTGKPRLSMIATGTTFDPSGLIKGLQSEGHEVHLQTLDCLIATVDTFVVELAKGQTLGLLLTRHTAAALCLANRVRGIRAIWGIDAGTVARDAAAVGANLLVVDPAATGFFQLRQMVVQFCRQGPRECPEVFAKRLG